jgi:NtrC-family two-component system sensor histidine kinase KinB
LIAPELPRLMVDESLVSRVFTNLVDNAIRHTPNNGHVRLEATHDHTLPTLLRISVTDTGKGVPPDQRERVFEKFAQIPKSVVHGHRGSGLGLTLCKLVVEAHGGKIWIESGPEGGAAFFFTLPIAEEGRPLHERQPADR